MCGRYGIDDSRDSGEWQEILEQVNRRVVVEPIKSSGEIFPTDVVPVIARSRRLTPAAFAMRWGYAMPGGKRLINARSETAGERPLFRDGMLHRRCAVPATNYYEWERTGREKVKYAIRPATDGLLYMAGIYRVETDGPAFSILTRDPAESIAFIHDRMPVILPPELVGDWLNPEYSAGEILKHAVLDVSHVRTQKDGQMRMVF